MKLPVSLVPKSQRYLVEKYLEQNEQQALMVIKLQNSVTESGTLNKNLTEKIAWQKQVIRDFKQSKLVKQAILDQKSDDLEKLKSYYSNLKSEAELRTSQHLGRCAVSS